ncbi:hypothetical protein E4U38_004177 [Claviceps purpurea]|nr:hypothetical protein E4U38_004177 [Claviceps purpurea]
MYHDSRFKHPAFLVACRSLYIQPGRYLDSIWSVCGIRGPKAQMRTLKKQKASGASDLKNQGRQPVEATICHLKLVEGSTRTTPNFQVVERLHFLPEPGSGTPPLAFPGPDLALGTASRPTKIRRRTPSCASEPRFNLSEAPLITPSGSVTIYGP